MLMAKLKKWGNSFGVSISKADVKALGLHAGQEVSIQVRARTNPLKELFGALRFDEPTEKILRDVRKGQSKYM